MSSYESNQRMFEFLDHLVDEYWLYVFMVFCWCVPFILAWIVIRNLIRPRQHFDPPRVRIIYLPDFSPRPRQHCPEDIPRPPCQDDSDGSYHPDD